MQSEFLYNLYMYHLYYNELQMKKQSVSHLLTITKLV